MCILFYEFQFTEKIKFTSHFFPSFLGSFVKQKQRQEQRTAQYIYKVT